MVRLDRKKTREKGVPVVDFQYVFFGRHKGNNAVKYLTAFVFLIILISVAAFWMQAPAATNTQQKSQNQPAPQPQAESVFVPALDSQFQPESTYYNNNRARPAWKYSLPAGTKLGAVAASTRMLGTASDRTYDKVLAYKSQDSNWMFIYRVSASEVRLEPDENLKEVSQSEKLLTTTSSTDIIFQVIKLEGDCLTSTTTVCPYVKPEDYFSGA